ncbi:MAG: sulfur carrier protein ThiS [Solirubrobacteraceae bacterium]
MKVLLNGEHTEVADDATLREVLAGLGVEPRRGVAVAVGGEVVPRGEWGARVLEDGTRVEVVSAVQGG